MSPGALARLRQSSAIVALAGVFMASLALGSLGLAPAGAGTRFSAAAQALEDAAGEAPLRELVAGDLAPEFDLPDIDGNRVALAPARDRETVLVVVWAVWCPPCIREFKELKRLHREFAGRGLRILAVAVRSNQSIEEVRGFARDLQVPFPVLYDESDSVAQRYGVAFIPSNFLIDGAGVVRLATSSLPADIDARIEDVLAGS